MKDILEVRGQQAIDILGLLKQVATDEGNLPLHPIHEETLLAMAEHLFQNEEYSTTSEAMPLKDAGDVLRTQALQEGVMNMAGILPFLEEDGEQERIAAVGRLGEAMGFDRKFTKRLHQLSHEAVMGLALCLNRPLSLEVGSPLWKGILKLGESVIHVDGDKKTLARYEGYRDIAPDTLGGTLIAYYRDNDFPLPGTPGAFFSNSLWVHDVHHVLAGYPTTPLGETCIFAFDGAMMKMDMGKALIGYIAQFQVGLQFDKGLRTWKNQFKPEVVMRAFERGGGCSVDYLKMDFDFGDLFLRPLAEVREEFGIDPEGALINGPEDSWCGEYGIVGQRSSPDLVERKQSMLARILKGHNTKD